MYELKLVISWIVAQTFPTVYRVFCGEGQSRSHSLSDILPAMHDKPDKYVTFGSSAFLHYVFGLTTVLKSSQISIIGERC